MEPYRDEEDMEMGMEDMTLYVEIEHHWRMVFRKTIEVWTVIKRLYMLRVGMFILTIKNANKG